MIFTSPVFVTVNSVLASFSTAPASLFSSSMAYSNSTALFACPATIQSFSAVATGVGNVTVFVVSVPMSISVSVPSSGVVITGLPHSQVSAAFASLLTAFVNSSYAFWHASSVSFEIASSFLANAAWYFAKYRSHDTLVYTRALLASLFCAGSATSIVSARLSRYAFNTSLGCSARGNV